MNSNCCNAPMIVRGSGEGTQWYQCQACGKPCDGKTEFEHFKGFLNDPTAPSNRPDAAPLAGHPKKWVETWRIQIRVDGLGSLPDRNSLEIVYDCAGDGQVVVVGQHTGIDCLNLTNANLIVEAVNSHATLLRERDQLAAIARGVLTALEYPRGSEAQVRCLEEVGQDAQSALASVQPEDAR